MKAAVFDSCGQQHAIASRRTPLKRPHPGWVEADPAICLQALEEVIAEAGNHICSSDLVSIGISGAMVGAWLVDTQGCAVRPGINWEDSRSQSLLNTMIGERPSLMADIFSLSGSVLQQGCTLPLLAWLKQNEPESIRRTARILTYKDFLRAHLTRTFANERSEVAVMPGDARRQGRSPELLNWFNLADLNALFPEVLDSQQIAGYLVADVASRTGLPAGVPVIAGAGDVIATTIGAGGLKPDAATAILGTTCMAGVCHRQPVFTPPELGLLFSLPEAHWYRAMVNVAGTLNLDWIIKLLAPELADKPHLFTQVTSLAEASPPGANGITYLPYLSESGIIAPVADPQARAQFSGMHAGHDRNDIIRAVYEGVAFALADLIELLESPDTVPVTLTGGGSRSALWCQMIADITRRPIIIPATTEFGAKGAALLAATALGHFDSVVAASAVNNIDATQYTPAHNAEEIWHTPRERYTASRHRLLNYPRK